MKDMTSFQYHLFKTAPGKVQAHQFDHNWGQEKSTRNSEIWGLRLRNSEVTPNLALKIKVVWSSLHLEWKQGYQQQALGPDQQEIRAWLYLAADLQCSIVAFEANSCHTSLRHRNTVRMIRPTESENEMSEFKELHCFFSLSSGRLR